jgi:hypothetical protein
VKGLLFGAIIFALSAPATARDLSRSAYLTRVMKYAGIDATMELYLAQSMLSGSRPSFASMRSTVGCFALDLSAAHKGKSLEPVRVCEAIGS